MGGGMFTPDFDEWRYYDDGTETGASPREACDTDTTITNDSDVQFQLRVRIQETGGADGAATDDYQLQYRLNGGGSWTSITAATTRVQADTGSALSDGSASTNRDTDCSDGGLTDGTGSFVAGEQEAGNGVIEDHLLTTDNFTEHVWGLLLIAADNANGDFLQFRIALNGGNPGLSNSVVPRLDIVKSAAIPFPDSYAPEIQQPYLVETEMIPSGNVPDTNE